MLRKGNRKIRANVEIRTKLLKHDIPYWELAEELGVSENTIGRWFRTELSDEAKAIVLKAIDNIIKRE